MGHDAIDDSLFPVGELEKPEVRKLASENDFKTAAKKDSTGICFIGERRFSDFLSQYLKKNPGPIKNPDGEVIGEHQGLMYHTIGQRQGMGIGGLINACEAPWYVADKDMPSNTLWACQGNDHPALFATALQTSDIFWIAGEAPGASIRCSAKIRYRQADQQCTVTASDDGYLIQFDEPQRAITPGNPLSCTETTNVWVAVLSRRYSIVWRNLPREQLHTTSATGYCPCRRGSGRENG